VEPAGSGMQQVKEHASDHPADEILKKEQRIMEIMAEIKAVLKERP
jgi:hypothetical protein